MCTVTYIPSGSHFFFTSSRDEQAGREAALLPEIQMIDGQQILFPRDPKGGGSWIAASESGNMIVLLNGAIKRHESKPPYRKSRGLVLLDLISAKSPIGAFETADLNGIEPFTVIIFDDQNLYCGKWDGRMKWQETLNAHKAHIWSSVTLYDTEAIRKRERWFNEWLTLHPYPGTLDIIHFHQKGGDGDPFNNILMKRGDHLYTNSISSMLRSPDTLNFRYLDLNSGKNAERFLPVKNRVPVQA